MAHTTWLLAEFMLQHISEILREHPLVIGDYCYGERVQCYETFDNYSVVTVGTVQGFEYFNDDSFSDTGLFYQIKVESGKALLRDGTVLKLVSDEVERIRAENVYPLDVALPVVKTGIVV